VDVWLPEDDKEIALAGILQLVRHMQIGVHARLKYRNASKLAELGGVRFVVEGAGDQNIEICVARFSCCFDEVGAGDRSKLRPDEDGCTSFFAPFEIATLGADELSRPWRERGKDDLVLLV